jgi:hypothetical protein
MKKTDGIIVGVIILAFAIATIMVIPAVLVYLKHQREEMFAPYPPLLGYDAPLVHITMTTIPERFQSFWFERNLRHLLGTIEGKFLLWCNIPAVFGKTGEAYVVTPGIQQLLEDFPHFRLFQPSKDWGPITKLMGAVENDAIPLDAPLLVCDDDIAYYPGFVNSALEYFVVDPTRVYTYCAKDIYGFRGYMVQKRTCMDIPLNLPASCFRIDDDLLNLYFGPTVAIRYKRDMSANCTFDTFIHDHLTPTWVNALKYDDRPPMQRQCKVDFRSEQAYQTSFLWRDACQIMTLEQRKFDYASSEDFNKLPRSTTLMLVTHKAAIFPTDYTFPSEFASSAVEQLYAMYDHIYVENLDRQSLTPAQQAKTHSLPIGIDFHTLQRRSAWGMPRQPWYEQNATLQRIQTESKPLSQRKLHILITWGSKNNTSMRYCPLFKSRPKLFQEALGNPLCTVYTGDRESTWKAMAESAFVYSPIGNGFDCHRTWEALALGCIVIAQDNPTVREFTDEYPIVLHDSPSTITQGQLVQWAAAKASASPSSMMMKHWVDRVNKTSLQDK